MLNRGRVHPLLDAVAARRLEELPKMSTTLLQFAEPLLDACDPQTAEDMRVVLATAVLLWNAPLEPLSPRRMQALRRQVAQSFPAATDRVFETLERSRSDVFGDDPRSAGIPTVAEEHGEIVGVQVPVLNTSRLRDYLAAPPPAGRLADLAPEFAEFVAQSRLDHRFVVLGIPDPFPADGSFVRRRLHLGWQQEEADWEAPELRALLRGDGVPPADHHGRAFTERYAMLLMAVEHAMLCVARALPHVPTDREVREAYRDVRLHLDGCRDTPVTAVVWQALALTLARAPWSARDVEAVLARLERSVRFHERWPGGTEYCAFLFSTLPV